MTRTTIRTSALTTMAWLLVGLAATPNSPAHAEAHSPAHEERLVELLALHDAREAIYAPRQTSQKCSQQNSESER